MAYLKHDQASKSRRKWGRVILFILFLALLGAVLKGMGWCIGGVCDAGTDLILPK